MVLSMAKELRVRRLVDDYSTDDQSIDQLKSSRLVQLVSSGFVRSGKMGVCYGLLEDASFATEKMVESFFQIGSNYTPFRFLFLVQVETFRV